MVRRVRCKMTFLGPCRRTLSKVNVIWRARYHQYSDQQASNHLHFYYRMVFCRSSKSKILNNTMRNQRMCQEYLFLLKLSFPFFYILCISMLGDYLKGFLVLINQFFQVVALEVPLCLKQ